MIKFIILLLSSIILLSCVNTDMHFFRPIYISSIYYDKLYTSDTSNDRKRYELSRWMVTQFSLCIDSKEKCKDYGYDTILSLYQDAKRECFLFSKTHAELIALDWSARRKYGGEYLTANSRYVAYNPNYIIVVTKSDVIAISKKEYEDLKSSIKSHPYDPSLCKSKPSDI